MTITHLDKGDNGSGSSKTTASLTYNAGDLLIAIVYNKLDPSGGNTPSMSGSTGLTWDQVINKTSGKTQITVFRALASQSGSGTQTISFSGQSQNNINWSIDKVVGADQTGTNGSGAIVQSGSTNFNSTIAGITVSLAALSNPSNITYGGVGFDANTTITVGSGFTLLYDSNTTLSAGAFNAEYGSNNSVSWTWSNQASLGEAVALEIKAGPSGGIFSDI